MQAHAGTLTPSRRELQEEAVSEWRAKYLNYKLGKKKVKAVSRALGKANKTPRTPRSTIFRRDPPAAHPSFSSPRFQRRPSTSERDLLQSESTESQNVSYGSIANTSGQVARAPSLKLPGPALSPSLHGNTSGDGPHETQRRPQSSASDKTNLDRGQDGADGAEMGSPAPRPVKRRTMSLPHSNSMNHGNEQSLIKRMFTNKFNVTALPCVFRPYVA